MLDQDKIVLRVTVDNVRTGEQKTYEIGEGSHVVICAEPAHVDGEKISPDVTVVTVKHS